MKGQPLTIRLGFAWQGIKQAWLTEASFRSQVFFALLAVIYFAFLQVSAIWWALLFILIGLILALELINSALEAALDHLHPETHPAVGRAKDMAAGAVWVMALTAIVFALFATYQFAPL